MADILIRGMEMPGHCRRCPLRDNDDSHCVLQPASAETDTWEFQRKHCPLLPLPEGHGDLIEKKSAKAKFCQFCFWKHQNKDACERCAGCPIDFLTTIVPAEGGTDECSEN